MDEIFDLLLLLQTHEKQQNLFSPDQFNVHKNRLIAKMNEKEIAFANQSVGIRKIY